MSRRELDNFFPGLNPDQPPFGPGVLLRLDTEPSADWEKTWKHFQPDIIVTSWSTPPLPEKADFYEKWNLPYICHVTGSVRHIVPRSFIERGGLVSNWGGIAAPMVAEHALLLTLAMLRNINSWHAWINTPNTTVHRENNSRTRSLHGRHVGLHGFGAVARHLVQLLAPFNVKISAYSQGVPPEWMHKHGVNSCPSLEQLFKTSEILIECEAATEQSAGSVTREILNQLPSNAVFVNVGRGIVVDENALSDLARSQKIRVASDVSIAEPNFANSPLCNIPNTLLSPHIGGPTDDHLVFCGQFATENILRFLQGKTPLALVNLAVFDRST